jgi:predicted O-linked N-acetylglucosamine transferase (SPINDLY family)
MTKKAGKGGLEQTPNVGRLLQSVESALGNEQWAQVRELCEPVLEEFPECPEALFALALASVRELDLARAAALAERAFAIDPNVQEYADLLAVVHGLAGDLNTSVYYAKLVTTIPSSQRLRDCMSTTVPSFVTVLQTISEKPLYHRAAQAMVVEDWTEAEHWLRQHLAFEPGSQEAYLALGTCLMAQGTPRAAVEALRAGQHQLPPDPDIASLLAKALGAVGRFDESAACYRWARAQAPDDAAIGAAQLVQRLYDPRSEAGQTAAAFREWGHRFGLDGRRVPELDTPAADGQLTIGYLVAGCGGSASAKALTGILAHRDSRRFTTVGFGYGSLDKTSNIAFQKCVDRWQDISGSDPLTLAAMVRAEGIDILVDLAGFSAPDLLVAFGTRMAPCQVAWLDSPAGTGLTAMDFLLTDKFVDPDPSGGGRYSEWLAYLRQGSVVAAPAEPLDAAIVPRESSGMVFAADATLMEINPVTVEYWAHTLHAVPQSVLILRDHDFRDPENLAHLIGLFGDFGLAHRVDVVAEPSPVSFFRKGDVCLLPVPYPAPQSAMNALSAGVPVVCPAGEGRQTRLAASLLDHLELDEPMVAETRDDYVALAVEWAVDENRQKRFRATIGERLKRAGTLDPKARAQDLEAAYEEMWKASVGRYSVSSTHAAPAA